MRCRWLGPKPHRLVRNILDTQQRSPTRGRVVHSETILLTPGDEFEATAQHLEAFGPMIERLDAPPAAQAPPPPVAPPPEAERAAEDEDAA